VSQLFLKTSTVLTNYYCSTLCYKLLTSLAFKISGYSFVRVDLSLVYLHRLEVGSAVELSEVNVASILKVDVSRLRERVYFVRY
jgi:hypothetical protein